MRAVNQGMISSKAFRMRNFIAQFLTLKAHLAHQNADSAAENTQRMLMHAVNQGMISSKALFGMKHSQPNFSRENLHQNADSTAENTHRLLMRAVNQSIISLKALFRMTNFTAQFLT